MTDEQILRKMRQGNPAGLEAMMDRYIPYVSAIAWNILREYMPKEDAEEVVSDVFLAAWEQADALKSGHVKQWLGAVARNKAKNRLRLMGHNLPLEEDVLEIPDEFTPVSKAEKAEERRQVRKAVNSLGEPDREIFLRHYFFGQTVSEIGTGMRLNESTIKTKLRRGRQKLKEMLTRWDAL